MSLPFLAAEVDTLEDFEGTSPLKATTQPTSPQSHWRGMGRGAGIAAQAVVGICGGMEILWFEAQLGGLDLLDTEEFRFWMKSDMGGHSGYNWASGWSGRRAPVFA